MSQGLAGNASKCLTKKERLLGIKGALPWALPQPGRARLACHPAVICRDWSSLAAVAAGGWEAGCRAVN